MINSPLPEDVMQFFLDKVFRRAKTQNMKADLLIDEHGKSQLTGTWELATGVQSFTGRRTIRPVFITLPSELPSQVLSMATFLKVYCSSAKIGESKSDGSKTLEEIRYHLYLVYQTPDEEIETKFGQRLKEMFPGTISDIDDTPTPGSKRKQKAKKSLRKTVNEDVQASPVPIRSHKRGASSQAGPSTIKGIKKEPGTKPDPNAIKVKLEDSDVSSTHGSSTGAFLEVDDLPDLEEFLHDPEGAEKRLQRAKGKARERKVEQGSDFAMQLRDRGK